MRVDGVEKPPILGFGAFRSQGSSPRFRVKLTAQRNDRARFAGYFVPGVILVVVLLLPGGGWNSQFLSGKRTDR